MGKNSPLTTESEAGTRNRSRMRSFVLLSLSFTTLSAAPQGGLISTISNLLTSVVGGGNTGEVDGYENAPYSVVNTYDGYEERFYPSKMWVCTRSGRGGFMKLFGYISGDNSGNQKKSMYGYATTMGGYPNFENEARKLKSLLERSGVSGVDFSAYMAMSYDNPWKIMNRRNDVMYAKL